MPTADRQVNIQITGSGLNENNSFVAAQNTSSPAQILNMNLINGNNTISTPTGAVSVTIVPPAGNTVSIILKGLSGDSGIRLNNTDPTSLALDPTTITFILTTNSIINGMFLIWT